MLSDIQKNALQEWYSQDWILDGVRGLMQAAKWEELEEYVHMDALLPIGRHDALPVYMRNEKGAPLFPDNLNPTANLEGWQDAIEVGWTVVEQKLGLSHDTVHVKIRDAQDQDWESFTRRHEGKKRED